jgi:quinol monooxygenase YgiN
MKIVLLSRQTIDPAIRERYVDSARESAEHARRQAGNIAYSYSWDLFEPNVMNFVEAWESRAALDAHVAAPYHLKRVAELRELGVKNDWMEVYGVAATAKWPLPAGWPDA